LEIDILRAQRNVILKAGSIIERRFKEKTGEFHARLRDVLKLGLVREAIVARDVEVKERKEERSPSRKNSVASSMQKTMKSLNAVIVNDMMQDISEV
jgi:hypothetical protein